MSKTEWRKNESAEKKSNKKLKSRPQCSYNPGGEEPWYERVTANSEKAVKRAKREAKAVRAEKAKRARRNNNLEI